MTDDMESKASEITQRWSTPASGLVTALEPAMSACGGAWIAHGSGDADREVVDDEGKILVPLEEECYSLKRVWQHQPLFGGRPEGHERSLRPLPRTWK